MRRRPSGSVAGESGPGSTNGSRSNAGSGSASCSTPASDADGMASSTLSDSGAGIATAGAGFVTGASARWQPASPRLANKQARAILPRPTSIDFAEIGRGDAPRTLFGRGAVDHGAPQRVGAEVAFCASIALGG